MKQNVLKEELEYIMMNYDFSENMTPELRDFLIEKNLIELDNDTDLIFITTEGELYLGVSKAELREKYDEIDEDVETYSTDEEEQELDYDDEF